MSKYTEAQYECPQNSAIGAEGWAELGEKDELQSVFLFIRHIRRFICTYVPFHFHSIILFFIWCIIDPDKTTTDHENKQERKYEENPPHNKS